MGFTYKDQFWQQVKKQILSRDKRKCQYCNEHAIHVDHIIPFHIVQKHEAVNLVACCGNCNSYFEGQLFKGFRDKKNHLIKHILEPEKRVKQRIAELGGYPSYEDIPNPEKHGLRLQAVQEGTMITQFHTYRTDAFQCKHCFAASRKDKSKENNWPTHSCCPKCRELGFK